MAKRHVLAEHLREVIDLLELKVGCIGARHNILTCFVASSCRPGLLHLIVAPLPVSWSSSRVDGYADSQPPLQADQIAELYDLLTFQDKPAEPRENGNGTGGAASGGRKSVHDVMRMVKESLGEEAMKRLEQDGLGYTTRRRAHKVL